MSLIKWKPAETQLRFRGEFDKLFDRFFNSFYKDTGFSDTPDLFPISPRADIEESDREYLVSVELPGIDKKDIKLQLENNRLVIKGEKKQEKEKREANYISCERSYGSFQRIFDLPSGVKTNEVDAEFKDGILSVKLPKTEESKRKEIPIKIK